MPGKLLFWLLVPAALAFGQSPAAAQQDGGLSGIPPTAYPPPNSCRIWLQEVPEGLQPRPTDCATAEREAPANSRVIYGVTVRVSRGGDVAAESPAAGADDRNRRQSPCAYSPVNRRQEDCAEPGAVARRASFSTGCPDRNLDGWCDDAPLPASYSSLPLMASAVQMERGFRNAEMRQWIGDGDVVCRTGDTDRGVRPLRALCQDRRTAAILQIWTDGNRDGRVDEIAAFRNGHPVRVVRR